MRVSFVKFSLVLLSCLSCLLAQSVAAPEGIPPEAPRLQELKQQASSGKSFPRCMQLKYKGKQGDYAIFYDLNGEDAYFKYRRNKFDLRAESLIRNLKPGLAYLVSGTWVAMLVFAKKDETFYPAKRFDKKLLLQEKESIENRNNIPIFLPTNVGKCQLPKQLTGNTFFPGFSGKFYLPLYTGEIMY
ncbi:MAG: hypothetical protein AAF518_13960 [Spirochaetota bacterium]